MTARAGYLAQDGTFGSSVDRLGIRAAAYLAGPEIPSSRWKMRALNSLSAIVTWLSTGPSPDTSASQYTGGNTPLSNISVADHWEV